MFFTRRSSVIFVYIVAFFVFNSSAYELHNCTNIPKVTDHCNLMLFQVVLSFCYLIILFHFKSKNEFILEICQVRHVKKRMQSFPYENHCKCYKKLLSRLSPVPMLFTLTFFFLYKHSLLLQQNKKFM